MGSLSEVLELYICSPEWANLAGRTQYVWSRIIRRINQRWGQTSISEWSKPSMLQEILAWRNERAAQPRTADHQITVLHHLLSWARFNGYVEINAASGIPRLYRNGGRAEIIWLESEIDHFCAAAPQPIADGMRLASLTGLRRADLVGLRWTEIERLRINRVTEKSGRCRKRAMVPITPDLKALLDLLITRPRAASCETVLANSRGRSWSGDGFTHGFNTVRDRLGIKHTDGRLKHLHDVRGTYATKLVKAGLTDQQIGDIMGWSAMQVADIRKLYVHDDAAMEAVIKALTTSKHLM